MMNMTPSERPPGSAKLFVGQIGKATMEGEIQALLEPFGEVLEVALMKDKMTGESKGCCFAIFALRSSAENAIKALHNIHTMPSWRSPLQLSFAKGEEERMDAKLFVGGISKDASEDEVRQVRPSTSYTYRGSSDIVEQLFKGCGEVQEIFIMKDRATGASKGCAFVKYATQLEAKRAIDTLSLKVTMPGAGEPLVVKWAETKDPSRGPGGPGGPGFMGRGDRDRDRDWDRGGGGGGGIPPVGRGWGHGPPMMPPQQGGWGMPQMGPGGYPSYPPAQSWQQPGPSQYNQQGPYGQQGQYGQQPPYNQQQPYGQAPPPQYGQPPAQYGQPPAQYGQPPSQYGQPAGQYNQTPPQYGQPAPQYGAAAAAPQYGAAAADPYAAAADPNGGMYGQAAQPTAYGYGAAAQGDAGGHAASAYAAPQTGGYPAQGGSYGGGGGGGGGPGGPPRSQHQDANLFILNIPASWSDAELASSFAPFGSIISATVFKDRMTGEAKGYGFVSYDNPSSAQLAITSMNGLQLEGKRLKVEVKKPKSNPY